MMWLIWLNVEYSDPINEFIDVLLVPISFLVLLTHCILVNFSCFFVVC